MTEPPALRIEQTEVDGVPVFWTPIDGPRVASLMFRVGRADEAAHQGGITHLVEHLALFPLAQQEYQHNGFVSPLRTVFHASGTDEQLQEFLGSVILALRGLPLDRIGLERRVLSQEASGRGPNPAGMLRWFRYGYAGLGLLGAEELGLDWLGPDPVAAWAESRFTRQNAALWWSGPPPATLRLDLPDGEYRPLAVQPTVPGVTFPCRTDLGGTGLSMGFLGARTAATRIMHNLFAWRIRQDLRFDRALIYDVATDYDPIGAHVAHLTVGTDCRREDAAQVGAAVLRIIEALRDQGPTAEEIAREAASFAEGSLQSVGRFGFLDGIAHDALLGRERETPDAIIAEYRAVTPQDIQAAASAALGSLLMLAPPGPYDDGTLTAYPGWSERPVEGRTIRPSGWLVGPRARKDRLIVGPDGVSWVSPDGRGNTVRYQDCVAIRHWEGSVRQLWGADGFRVTINAAEWRDGAKVIAEVDAAVPQAVVACDEHGIGALEVPSSPADQATGTTGPG